MFKNIIWYMINSIFYLYNVIMNKEKLCIRNIKMKLGKIFNIDRKQLFYYFG